MWTSFPDPDTSFLLCRDLGTDPPQMCPMVLGLMVVAHKQGVDLDVIDLARLCVVKTNSKHDPKCFYHSKATGKGVISAIPSKDKYYGAMIFLLYRQ